MSSSFKDKTPVYNVGSAALSKWRKTAQERDLTLEEKRAYGRAVLEAVGRANRPAPRATNHPCPCASGSWESDGLKILAAVRARNIKDMEAAIRNSFDDNISIQKYKLAMKEKGHADGRP